MLRGVAADVEFWKAIVKEHWNTAPSTVHLVPEDWPLVGWCDDGVMMLGLCEPRIVAVLSYVRLTARGKDGTRLPALTLPI